MVDDPVAMWKSLESAFVLKRPGARFQAYSDLVREEGEPLPALVARIESTMRRIQELCPDAFDLAKLDDELQSMAMIRALPAEYQSFVSALMLKNTLDKAIILSAFQNKDILRSGHSNSVLSARAASASTPTSPPIRSLRSCSTLTRAGMQTRGPLLI